MTPPATRPGLLGRGARLTRDPLVIGCGLVAALVFVLHGYDGLLTRDVAVYAYGGQRVADGVPPYLGLLNRAGPLAHLVPGVGALAAGLLHGDDLLAMRVLYTVLTAVSVSVTYALGRDLFGSRASGLAAAAALLSFHGLIDYATYGPREKTVMVLFLLAALLAMRHQRWATTGVLISLATLTWQPVFVAAIVGVVVTVWLGPRTGRTNALLRVAVGGLVPALVTVGAYAIVGALHQFLDAFILINARYTMQKTFLGRPLGNWNDLVDGFGASLVVLLIGLVAGLALGVRGLLRRGQERDPAAAAVVGCAAAALVSVAWTLRAFNNWPDAFLLLPLAAVGMGGLASLVVDHLAPRAALALVLTWTLIGVGLATTYALAARDTSLRDQRRDTATVLGLLPPGTQIFSIAAPEPLVLAGQVNPGRYQLFGNGLSSYVEDTYPGGMAGYGRWVARQEPTVIAMGTPTVPTWLAATIESGYARVGSTGGFTWYVRRELGAPTRQALREALRG